MMRLTGALACMIALTAVMAWAADTSATRTDPWKDHSHVGLNPGPADGREGGETIADAFVIPALPFFLDTGNTCDNADDYEEACPFWSNSPDVVYVFIAPVDDSIDIDLCGSLYDTKVFVYEDEWAPGIPYACNDDHYYGDPCGDYVSKIEEMVVHAGHSYYIVIDGYFGDCGEYSLLVEPSVPCVIDCPAGALLEGEPALVDGYVDQWNGGCGSHPVPLFQPITGQSDGCATMCAVSGWYRFEGADHRDTDWFEVVSVGETITWTIEAEYDIHQSVISPDCANPVVLMTAQVDDCVPNTISFATTPGQIYWLWVGPQDFTGPVGEFDYVMDLCGLVQDPIGTMSATWGAVKVMYDVNR